MALKRISRNFTLQWAVHRVDMFIGNTVKVSTELESVKRQLAFDLMKTYGELGVATDTIYNMWLHGQTLSTTSPKVIDYSTAETNGLTIRRVKAVCYKFGTTDAQVYLDKDSGDGFAKYYDTEAKDVGRAWQAAYGEGLIYIEQGTGVSESGANFSLNITRYPNPIMTDLAAYIDLPDYAHQYWIAVSCIALLQQRQAEIPGFLKQEQEGGLANMSRMLSDSASMLKQTGKDQIS